MLRRRRSRGGRRSRPGRAQPHRAARRGRPAAGAALEAGRRLRLPPDPRRAGRPRPSRRAGQAGFATALPVVVGRGSHLLFRLWRPGEPTVLGPMGIPEPLEAAPAVEPDLLFVPLACFDRRGHRIGYGAGYYDRTLERLRATKTIRAVGVAYGVCEVAAVPYEAHDQTLDAIVTEQETIFVSGR